MTINVHVYNEESKEVLELLNLILKQNQKIMDKQTQINASLAQLNDATNAIAAKIQKLIDEEADNVSEESLAALKSVADQLTAMGADATNPIPPVV